MAIIRGMNKSGSALSVSYYGARPGKSDNRTELNLAFEQARVQRRAVYAPGGTYDVSGPLLWGTQTVGSQSDAPGLLYGDGAVTRFKATAGFGLVGYPALFNGKNIAGSVLRDFTVDTNALAGVQGVNVDWDVDVGPSLSNTYERIWVENVKGAVGWSGNNNNDCSYRKIIVRNTSAMVGLPSIKIDGRGGLITLEECQWPDNYASVGAQIVNLIGCWGKGLAFLASCENVVNLNGGYLYSSAVTGAIFSTENTKGGCKVEALNIGGAWLDIGEAGSVVFKGRYATGATMRAACLTSSTNLAGKLFDPGIVADLGARYPPMFLFEHSRKTNLVLDWTVPTAVAMKRTRFDDGGVMINDA